MKDKSRMAIDRSDLIKWDAWYRVKRLVRNALLWMVAIAVLATIVGTPAVQWDCKYHPGGTKRIKIEADYWTITGKKLVYRQNSPAGDDGFPILIFVPFGEVVDLKATWDGFVGKSQS